ncbi:hypothetical protein [Cohnella herbarum]|uniref:DUF2178 domain-containing protein n=1 Tax=Cohnella herbarum TaxID=2728023 RepID=A0A7Z2ZMR8_9BACL|nr:hypothetical protein [Cohnella herbarum]QJD85671.1 hypothetical protein HH215_22450 [Cohnella herbarum]
MKTIGRWVLLTIVGASAAYMGEFILIEEKLKGIAGLLFGVGSVLVVLGLGNMVHLLWLNKPKNKVKYDAKIRTSKIEAKDERKIRIKEKAGWKTNIIIFYILMALTVVFSLIGIDKIVVTVLSGVFVFQIGLGIFLFNHYAKKM